MKNPVTPWTATVQSDIENGSLLHQYYLSNTALEIYNCGDSIWLKASRSSGGATAYRLAFAMNSIFEEVSVFKNDGNIVLKALTRLGNYIVEVSFPESDSCMFRYTTVFTAAFPMLIPYWPRDIVPLTSRGKIENTTGIIHAHQVGTRSGILYFSMTQPTNGTVFYFQNLSAMSAYCQASETSLSDTVGGSWPEIGFEFPVNRDKPIPADTEFTISDAFVILDEDIVREDTEVVVKFLQNLAEVYRFIPRPEPLYQDWLPIAKNALEGLSSDKGSWTTIHSVPFLNAYVGDYTTPAEIMVQLAVLLPLHEYLTWSGKSDKLYDELNKGLEGFYDKRVNSIVRWHPDLEDDLDKSEEQKREMVMDSWYLHHPLLNLARLALRGDKIAGKLFLDSIDYAIKVAHEFNYEWPVFYKMTTLEVLKAETSPGEGGEKDVPGSYAHVMLMAYKLTGEKRFIKEAVTALKSLEGLAFDVFYQANNTAFTAGALAELYRETNDQKYLNLSYSCLAGIFKNVQIWDCNYGYAKDFPNFFAVFPLNDAPYTAAYEEFEVYAALHHYMEVTEGLDILPSLKILIPEFIKYAVSRLPYYYPSMLPEEMIADEIKTGEIHKALWVPLEDIQDGWEKSGGVGQEVYGAGVPFGVIPRQYFTIEELPASFYINYPAVRMRFGKGKVTFGVPGHSHFKVTLLLLGLTKPALSKVKIEIKDRTAYKEVLPGQGNRYEFPANSNVRISW